MWAFTTAMTPSGSVPDRAIARSAAAQSSWHEPRERGVLGDMAGEQVRVGDGGEVAAPAVASGARHCARALGSDHQGAAVVDPRDRPAARTDGDHVERRQPHRQAGDVALGRGLRATVEDEADVGARAAHVEADRVGEAIRRRDRGRGGNAAGRPRQQQRGGTLGRRHGVDQATGRRHHEHLRGFVGETT